MIWQCDATVTYAYDGLIKFNKFVSRITENSIIYFIIIII